MPKSRGYNFTERERIELINIISKYRNILDNKKTDSITNKEKKEAWRKITLDYNACVERQRDEMNLKHCYGNIKTGKQHLATETVQEFINRSQNIQHLYQEVKNDIKLHNENVKSESLQKTSGEIRKKQEDTSNIVTIEPDVSFFEEKTEDQIVAEELSHKQDDKTFQDELIEYTIAKEKKMVTEIDLNRIYWERKIQLIHQEITNNRTEHGKKMELLELQLQQQKEKHDAQMALLKMELEIKRSGLHQ